PGMRRHLAFWHAHPEYQDVNTALARMKHTTKTTLGTGLILLACLAFLSAQDYDYGDQCTINSNVGLVLNEALNTTAQVASTGWGATAGAGYNFNKRNALIGEFMWNRIYPASRSLQPFQSSNLDGTSDIYMVTGNYRFELRGKLFGAYLIGGGGLYIRHTNLSAPITSTSGTACTPSWLWWGFTCTSGTVDTGQTLTRSTSIVPGGNVGGGITFRAGPAPYRLYVEARYHYASTNGISTQFVAIAFGGRF